MIKFGMRKIFGNTLTDQDKNATISRGFYTIEGEFK